ncbi:Ovarian-specific serine/threonine-protein kinase Lok [Frankliniella fusca]|uniref:Ovarian-specific serine/threonine-protein kinase Lok n=1 Tax=Frankliniella fusca TaxID=407009 RepID=A0AAE1LSP9_9NEOP|nr:Ovarian-specific serine/threonine-protein kinase Lok [Frankliniella fusca]
MADEGISATQPVDQINPMSSQEDKFYTPEESSPSYWGRLYPADFKVKFHDLVEDEVTVGKLAKCNVTIRSSEVPNKVFAVISRHHFTIRRTQRFDKLYGVTCKVVLEDCSMNSTFVNDVRVGKGCFKTLQDNSIIAVGSPHNKIFYFKDASEGLVNDSLPHEVNQKFHVGMQLGAGAFGIVSLVFCKKTGKNFAMKTICKKSNGHKQKRAKDELSTLENEIKILKKIDHPNVIKLVHDVDCHVQKYLFLELMKGNDLFARITDSKRLTERQSKLYFYQIASGVKYLHSMGIVHRDLKPENVLLATQEEDTLVKISDFGLSKVVTSISYVKSLCGTKMYVAPEVLESRGSKKYTAQVDVWSMGVILFVCLSGQTPFCVDKKGFSMEDQIKKGMYTMNFSRWECVSLQAKKIVKKMLTTNPVQRISISSIFEDPWLKDQDMLLKVNQLISQYSADTLNRESQPAVPVADAASLSPKSASAEMPTSASLKPESSKSPPRKRRRLI